MATENFTFEFRLDDKVTKPTKDMIKSVKDFDKALNKIKKSFEGFTVGNLFKAGVAGAVALKSAGAGIAMAFVHATAKEEEFRKKLELLTGSKEVAKGVAEAVDKIRPAFKGTEEEMKALVAQTLKLGFKADELKDTLPLAFDVKAITNSQEAAEKFLKVYNKAALGIAISAKETKFFRDELGLTIKEGIKGAAAMKAMGAAITSRKGGIAGAAAADGAKSLSNVILQLKEAPENLLQGMLDTKAFTQVTEAANNLLKILGPGSPMFEEIREAFTGLMDFIAEEFFGGLTGPEGKGAIESFGHTIVGVLKGLPEFLRDIRDGFKAVAPVIFVLVAGLKALQIFNTITKFVKAYQAAQLAANIAMSANPIGVLVFLIGGLIAALVYLVSEWDNVRVGATLLWRDIKEAFVGGFNALTDWGAETIAYFVEFGSMIWNGIKNGVMQGYTAAKEAILGTGKEMIKSFKDLFKISSPSKVFEGFGLMTGEGFAEGIKGSKASIEAAGAATLTPGNVINRSAGGTRVGGITINLNMDGGAMSSPEAFANRLSELLPSALSTVFEDFALEQGAST